MTLKGKVAVVTGGAQGIGKQAARTLAVAGAKVVIADLNGAEAERSASELRAISDAVGLTLDVRDEGDVRTAIERTIEVFGGLDVLVNNAAVVPHFRWGLPRWPEVSEMSLDFWDRVIRTNLYGTFLSTKYAVPHLRARGGGYVINLYGGGNTTPTGALAYAVTKDAIRTFTRFLAEEVRDANICAVTVSPEVPIATESAPASVKATLPGPEILGDAFVLAAGLPLEASGGCFAYRDGALVVADPMVG